MHAKDPIDVLVSEHELILQVLSAMEDRLATLGEGEFPAEFFRDVVDFLANFADGCHHFKEEDTLFPVMERRGVPAKDGPIGVMLHEHVVGRSHIAAIRENIPAASEGSAAAVEQIRSHAAAYIDLLRQHIHKENNILFRMARHVLSSGDLEALDEVFWREDNPKINRELRDRYTDLAARICGEPAAVALD